MAAAHPAGRLATLAVVSFAISVTVRWPYLAESFWVDELHSAWTVWGDLSDVARRAALGNQTPVYYWGLWIWRQLVGEGEVALRTSSVLLSSLACGVLAAGVARYSRSLVGGLAAGGALAIEPNAIFFGTELRVFAAIMLLAAVACWAWMEQHRSGSGRAAAVLVAAVLLAAIVQPTSMGVLGWLCLNRTTLSRNRLERVGRWLGRPPLGMRPSVFGLLTGLGVAAALLLLWWLAGRVLITAWQHRGQWAAFAAAHSPWQIWTMWRWDFLLIIPVGLASGLAIIERIRSNGPGASPASTPSPASSTDAYTGPLPAALWLRPALLAIGVTSFFWLVSAGGIAAVFHRRYLIATLPILVWAGASALGEACCRIHRLTSGGHDVVGAGSPLPRRPAPWRQPWLLLTAGVLVVLVSIRLSSARKSPFLRGEGWRAAVAYVTAHRNSDRPILLSPGLIETQRLLAQGSQPEIAYLAYPLSGPYRIAPVQVIDLADEPARILEMIRTDSAPLAVLRGSPRLAQRWAKRVVAASDPAAPLTFSVRSFGGVQVVKLVAEDVDQSPE